MPQAGFRSGDGPDLFRAETGLAGPMQIGAAWPEAGAVRLSEGDGDGRVAFVDDQGKLSQVGFDRDGCVGLGLDGDDPFDPVGLAMGEGDDDVVVDVEELVAAVGLVEVTGGRGGGDLLPEGEIAMFEVGVGGGVFTVQEDDEERDAGLGQPGGSLAQAGFEPGDLLGGGGGGQLRFAVGEEDDGRLGLGAVVLTQGVQGQLEGGLRVGPEEAGRCFETADDFGSVGGLGQGGERGGEFGLAAKEDEAQAVGERAFDAQVGDEETDGFETQEVGVGALVHAVGVVD